jgi:hypothetical protein
LVSKASTSSTAAPPSVSREDLRLVRRMAKVGSATGGCPLDSRNL